MTASSNTPRWGSFEVALTGPEVSNPFVDVEFHAVFAQGARSLRVPGFFDGQRTWRLRFMPDPQGTRQYRTASSHAELNGHSGSFTCTPAEPGVHGPVRVHNGYHFAYANGTPCLPFGTTCNAWTHLPLMSIHNGDVNDNCDHNQPWEWAHGLPLEDGDRELDLIDTRAMAITPLQRAPQPATPALGVRVPGRPGFAIRVRRRGA